MVASLAVIDSYDLIRHAYSLLLKQMGFSLIIEAKSGDDFMEQVRFLTIPALCLLSIETPSIQEFTTAKRIKTQYPDVKIIAYTLYERTYGNIEEYGIDMFLPKSYSVEELETVILQVMQS